MELGLAGSAYAVGGASSGLGRAIAERIIAEGGKVVGLARSRDTLQELADQYGERFISFPTDFTDPAAVSRAGDELVRRGVAGCVFNAGGPPLGQVDELTMEDWDSAYYSTLRWKVQLIQAVLPMMRERKSGKLLFLESVSIKQPIDNLVLSNAFRAGVAGFVKTLSREAGPQGITVNIIAPGYHDTERIGSVLQKAADLKHVDRRQIEDEFLSEVPLHVLGQPEDFAGVAAFLLSPFARYINGQTITIDGGMVRYTTG
ncbi:SDR family oxidoreductase [Lewinella sp. IMCC34183]|uniref:SDR family oxidoreductase n=1 Tax=Lewinella sp. IMCC34183 TaxID=2248762 RepID=UPI000E26BB87|nr:SDR family oxidoreductase [Lewinella sp. IMCC34183]